MGGRARRVGDEYPQTHVEWHKVVPTLAGRYTVVASDLRGYGDSDKPHAADGDLDVYCKRATAQDQGTCIPGRGPLTSSF